MLRILEYDVTDVRLGSKSELKDGLLIIAPSDLEELTEDSPYLESLEIDIARPGESVRISGVIDVIEPRTKAQRDEITFPGIGSVLTQCGSGDTLALRGVCVTTMGTIPPMGETFVQEDSVVDMTGESADYSPFSRITNIVLRCALSPHTPDASHMSEVRQVGVAVSRFLASLAAAERPNRSESYQEDEKRPAGAPGRVVYVCSLISEGPLHDTLLYGSTTEDMSPRWLPVTHMIDGALVSSDLHYSNQRTPTYLYQRNPIVDAVRDNPEIDLLGVIATLRYGSHQDKRQAAASIARMAKQAGADSMIVHPAVGGNAHVDAVDIVEEAEEAGMRSVLVLQEMAGARGTDFGLVHYVPEANALISTGNRDELVTLNPMKRLLGPPTLKNGDRLDQPVQISLRSFLCSTSQVGAHRLTAVAG